MKRPLFIFLFLIYCNTSAQSLINIDFENSILLRPNIGYEYRWKNNAMGGNIRWQRNAHIWISEWPGLMKANGINIDFYYKRFYPRILIHLIIKYKVKKALKNENAPQTIQNLYKQIAEIIYLTAMGGYAKNKDVKKLIK